MVAVSGTNKYDVRQSVKPKKREFWLVGWLVKFAPFRTSWAEILRHGSFTLRGVRNPAARNYLCMGARRLRRLDPRNTERLK